MTYATPRSCNQELIEGMTDGSYRKQIPPFNLIGQGDANLDRYEGLDPTHYGNMNERGLKRLPDGTMAQSRRDHLYVSASGTNT